MNTSGRIESTNQIIESLRSQEIIHLSAAELAHNSSGIVVNGEKKINFGSCSYLGLEFDHRLKEAAALALNNFGTQFSSSRAYLSTSLYDQLEDKLAQLFGYPTLVTPTTTLGHISALPVLIDKEDLVIVDHQAHTSMQTALNLVKAQGAKIELIRHNRIDLLEERILQQKGGVRNIWYIADGVYSMYGDYSPVKEIEVLMNKYPQFHFYVDDAHGMSCYGDNGKGYVLSQIDLHPQMVLATSFAKGFASGGGALVVQDADVLQKIRNCGSTMITSGPMQSAALGAAIASADIHLSPEISQLQNELKARIMFTRNLIISKGLPDLSEKESPIFFIGVGLPKVGYNLVQRLHNAGHLVNIGIFPAVPMKNTGIRFTITRLHSYEEIERLIDAIAYHYPIALHEEGIEIDSVYKAFNIEKPQLTAQNNMGLTATNTLKFELYDTILDLDQNVWNSFMSPNGMVDWSNMNLLENSFKRNTECHNNWDFKYMVIRDREDQVILCTFLTISITKDDMLMNEAISSQLENERISTPYFLTSKTLQIGSNVTEGCHLYINRSSPDWQNALRLLFNYLDQLQGVQGCETTIIRDFPADDNVLDDFMIKHGFAKSKMPDSHYITPLGFQNQSEYMSRLSKRSKRHFKENVLRHQEKFTVSVCQSVSPETLSEVYNLYLQVKHKSLSINTFELPFKLFEAISKSPNWEIILLYLKDGPEKAIGMAICHKTNEHYNGMLVGFDCSTNREHNTYRQLMFQVIQRANNLGYNCVELGMSADMEKRKFGSKKKEQVSYVQLRDSYNTLFMSQMAIQEEKALTN